jgi:hypothetical protein
MCRSILPRNSNWWPLPAARWPASSGSSLTKAIETARREVKQCLGTDRWLRELPGKEILEGFRKTHLPGVQSDTFKEQIVSAMVRAGAVPKDVDDLCDFVKAH